MRKLAPLILAVFCVPALAGAAGLININTADEAALESLPGIGSTKAEAVIAYRQAHGDFATISDIQNVSGIGPSTYAEIESLITVDAAEDGTEEPESPAASTSPPAPAQQKEVPVYVDAGGDRSVATGAAGAYSANVYDASGAAYQSPEVRWAFGDGTSAVGASVEKSYALPGTYLVSVSAVAEGSSGEDSFTVLAKAPLVRVAAISAEGITLANEDAQAPLDLSRWQLSAGGALFTFPPGTKLAPGASVIFAAPVTGLPPAGDAALLYPSGALAARYAPPPLPAQPARAAAQAQPPAPAPRSYQVQEAAPVSTSTDPDYAQTAVAPAAASELAAAGAPLPQGSGLPLGKIVKSPWTLGALGILAFSAAAFMVL
jgi:competence ComEA-like helix-hairpin-helix protein